MNFKKWVTSKQTAGYNGVHTVPETSKRRFFVVSIHTLDSRIDLVQGISLEPGEFKKKE